MNILYLVPQSFYEERKASIRARNMLTALAEAGHKVDVVCYPWGADPSIKGVRLHRVMRLPWVLNNRHSSLSLNCLVALRAFRMCVKREYDAVHAVEDSAFFARWLKKMFGLHFVYEMQTCTTDPVHCGSWSYARPSLRLLESLERKAVKSADVVLTLCKAISDRVRNMHPQAVLAQVEDAPLQYAFQDDCEGALRLRSKLGLGEVPVVVYAGGLEKHQGIELLLRAMSIVRRHREDVYCVLAGGEPDQVARMTRVASSLDLAGGCIFAGKLPPEDIPALMTMASVLVAPRIKGSGTAMKVYTYMQGGKPIVATRIGAHTQVLDDQSAILVMPHADDLANGILQALREPLLARALGREARARVATHYNFASFKHKVRSAYSQLSESWQPVESEAGRDT